MVLQYRRLVPADIPAVIDLTKDIWDGEDYMPAVIDRWIQQPDFYIFGAFTDATSKILAGIAQVRWFSSTAAWIEGGRVRPSIQKQGIGMQIAAHAIEHVQARGGKTCLYDTSSENHGSLAIAKHFGFVERDRVRVSILETREALFKKRTSPQLMIHQLTAAESIAAMRWLDNAPGEFICNGWSWAPLDAAFLSRLPWQWTRLGNAIALVIDSRSGGFTESAEPGTLWFVVHGNPDDAAALVKELLTLHRENPLSQPPRRRRDNKEQFHSLFCPESMAAAFEAIGFHPFKGKPEWVVLLEKRF